MVVLGVYSTDPGREARLIGGASAGATLEQASSRPHRAGTLPSPWMTPWFLPRNKDLRAFTWGQLAPCVLMVWSLMGVDRLV